MYEISLLPPEFKARQSSQQRLERWLLVSGGVLLVFLLIYSGLLLFTHLARVQARNLQEQRASVEQREAGFQKYVDMKNKIDRLHQLVQQAVGNRPDYATVVNQTGLNLPEGVWLTELTATVLDNQSEASSAPGNRPGELTIRGEALNQMQVADFLDSLQKVPGVTDIRCQSSKRKGDGQQTGVETVEFEIRASLPVDVSNKAKGGEATP